jgi:hypothetical protein
VGRSREPVILNFDAGWRIFVSCAQLALYTRKHLLISMEMEEVG